MNHDISPGIVPPAMAPEEALQLARSLLGKRKLADVERLCRSLLETGPDWPDVLNLLAITRVHRDGPSDEAVALLQRAVEIDSRHVDAYNNLGNVLKLLDRTDDAVSAYQRALSLNPNIHEALNNLGILYIQQQRMSKALKVLRQAIRCNPGMVQAHFNMGRVLMGQQKYRQAITAFRQVLKLNPDFIPAYRPLGALLYGLNRGHEAVELYREWLRRSPDNPVAQHMLAACSGEGVPERASDEYVKMLFDKHAMSFDDNLNNLGYKAPQLVAEVLAAKGVSGREILDAGCGTGLCGPLLKPYANTLTGVDLSPRMLEKARWRGVYDRLIEAELTAFLEQHPESYDAIVSADTLIYFGRLDKLGRAAAGALRQGGWLIFTVEHLANAEGSPGFRLGESGRYIHSELYLRETLTAAGFAVESINRVDLRMEAGRPVVGLVVTAGLEFR